MKFHFFPFVVAVVLATFPANGQILNADFEKWTNGFPDDWWTNDVSQINPITPGTPAHSGKYAVKGTALQWENSIYAPLLRSGWDGNGDSISTRPVALHGFYIFVPFYRDTLVIGITVSKGGTVIGGDTLLIGNETDSYGEFVANIHYTTSDTPDLINISFTIGRSGFTNPGAYFLLDDLSFGPAVGVDEPRTTLPSSFELSQNYPNPFNPTTTVSFAISQSSFVTLRVSDVLGREVATLVNEVKQPGEYTVVWNAEGIASGMYLYEFRSGVFSQTKKLILAK